MATSLPAVLLLVTLRVSVDGLSVIPKLDFADDSTSIGIKPDYHKEVTVPTLNPTEVKAVLEVNLVQSEPKPTTNQVLICTLDGKCKLHTIGDDKKGHADDDEEDDEDGRKEVYKPVIVSEFDVDPEQEVEGSKGKDHSEGKGKKKIPKVPVYVAHRGAAPDVLPLGPEHYPHRRQWGLPVYYGLKLGPEFHQHDNGVFRPVEYAPLHPRLSDIPDHVTSRPPGLVDIGYRYPQPYDKFFPVSRPRDGIRTIITPFGRRSSQGGVYWSTPSVVAVSSKMDLDKEVSSTATSPDEVKVVSKLGELE